MNDDDLAEFVEMQRIRPESEKSWTVSVGDLDAATLDLSPNNPNRPDEADTRTPAEILDEIEALDAEAAEVLASIRGML